jgi:hypothetical protein
MPSWRCPHCSTPQPESSRCWVCRRSSTSCGTCRHFRGSVAARIGFCGLDRRREPLHGDEVRACWEDGATAIPPDPPIPGLLDLLTEAVLPMPDLVPEEPARAARPDRPVPRLRSASVRSVAPSRDWVEVEV